MKKYFLSIVVLLLLLTITDAFSQGMYKNFKVAVYVRAYEVKQMGNRQSLDSIWSLISSQVRVDKIYLETHRDMIIVDDKTLETAKKYFQQKGLEVAGGITYTISESNRFQTYCYSNPDNRQKVKEIAELTARHFDEFILDDFFFTDCKCDLCIKAKGDMSWTDFRLKEMDDAARNLVIGPAKAVNPKVKVIIKYPNWYEHFQGLGFDLSTGPKIFDGIYTGTETRNPDAGGQHLQQYEGYGIMRYFDNIAPGKNGGGWVDTGGTLYMDRYAEQLWLTLFAKAPQVMLFDFRQMQWPLSDNYRASWQGMNTSFNYDEMAKPYKTPKGEMVTPTTFARAAGYTFEKVDPVIGELGTPAGIKSYKPYNSLGEDFLQNYLGMAGIPMDIVPEFPTEPYMIMLTEEAQADPDIVRKIEGRLKAGKNVMITSGLLRALEGKGIEDIVELRYPGRNALIKNFQLGRGTTVSSDKEILIPQIEYLTNDSWEDITSLDGAAGWPILHQARYSNGSLFVLTIPDNFADFYHYPPEVLNRIRDVLSQDMDVQIEGPSKVSLFIYDNNTFIVESFLPETVDVQIKVKLNNIKLTELQSGTEITGEAFKGSYVWGRKSKDGTSFDVSLRPHSFYVYRIK